MTSGEVLFGFYRCCGISNIPLVTTLNVERLGTVAKSCDATLPERYVSELLALRFE